MSAIKFEAVQIRFLSVVFVAVALVVCENSLIVWLAAWFILHVLKA